MTPEEKSWLENVAALAASLKMSSPKTNVPFFTLHPRDTEKRSMSVGGLLMDLEDTANAVLRFFKENRL